jgi:SAM-dependent methyltransferase
MKPEPEDAGRTSQSDERFELRLTSDNPNTSQKWDSEFKRDGTWEHNQGRRQTRLFAECFHRHVRIPLSMPFSVLDVGCALGDALPVWKKKYPDAELAGCDVSSVSVERCVQEFGRLASFFTASFESIRGTWDVIYCSNVLEHFEQHVEIASALLRRCRWLFIMTPYAELTGDGRPLQPAPGRLHVASFFENTFDALKQDGRADVSAQVISCPGAWGPEGWRRWRSHIYHRLGKLPPVPRQIIYTVRNCGPVDPSSN